jgi:hypothetical protein
MLMLLSKMVPKTGVYPVGTPNYPINMKINLSIYRIGGILTLEIRFKSRKTSLSRLLVPVPMIWHTHLDRS